MYKKNPKVPALGINSMLNVSCVFFLPFSHQGYASMEMKYYLVRGDLCEWRLGRGKKAIVTFCSASQIGFHVLQ